MNSPWLCYLYIYCSVGRWSSGPFTTRLYPQLQIFLLSLWCQGHLVSPEGRECLSSGQVMVFPILISLLLSSFSWIRTSMASSLGSSTGSTGSRLMWILSPLLHPCHLMGSSLWMDQGNRPLALSVPFPSLAKRSLLSLQPQRSRLPFSHCIF